MISERVGTEEQGWLGLVFVRGVVDREAANLLLTGGIQESGMET